jgi:tetratricopeptide (TPR) repeat protein
LRFNFFEVNKPIFLILSGVAAICLLFFFGRTTENKKKAIQAVKAEKTFNAQSFITEAKAHLTPSQLVYLGSLENSITRGDIPSQKIKSYYALANFWKDSARLYEPYAYYIIEATKLDKSEKSLTFAARLLLSNLRGEQDEAKLNWQSTEAIRLFEEALALNPENDDLKIGLGSVYVFGRGRSGNPEATMKGIQQLLSVTRKDSNNMKAQLVLGVGGLMSGQYDKAVDRLKKVVAKEPGNLEAIAYLADAYAASGNKAEAVKWYNISKKLVNDPHYTKEVDERIRTIR